MHFSHCLAFGFLAALLAVVRAELLSQRAMEQTKRRSTLQPTADATRLTLPHRTSPTANTPGSEVSSRYGERSAGHRAAARSSFVRSDPVLMKPFSSSATRPLANRCSRRPPSSGIRAYIVTRYRARTVAPPHSSRCSVPSRAHDLGACLDVDGWSLLDASNQVSRHAR